MIEIKIPRTGWSSYLLGHPDAFHFHDDYQPTRTGERLSFLVQFAPRTRIKSDLGNYTT